MPDGYLDNGWHPGFGRFVVDHYEYCKADAAWHEAAARDDNPDEDVVEVVFFDCHRNYQYRDDGPDHSWRVLNFFSSDRQFGDCEDFWLGAREVCKARGLASRMLMCRAREGDSRLHVAVLLGRWVFDCNMLWPVRYERFGELFSVERISGYSLLSAWAPAIGEPG